MFSAIFWVVLILQNSLIKTIIDLPPFLCLGSHVLLVSRKCGDDKNSVGAGIAESVSMLHKEPAHPALS